jgi:hypothetical protein
MISLQYLKKLSKEYFKLYPLDRPAKRPSKQEKANKEFLEKLLTAAGPRVTCQEDLEWLRQNDIVLLQDKKNPSKPIQLYMVEYHCSAVRNDYPGFIAVSSAYNKTYKRIYWNGVPYNNYHLLDIFFENIDPTHFIYLLSKKQAQDLGVYKVINPISKYSEIKN